MYLWALVFIIHKTETAKLWNFKARRDSRGHLVQELQMQIPSEPRKIMEISEIVTLRQQGVVDAVASK